MIRTLGLRGTPQAHPIEPTTSFAGFAGAVGVDVVWSAVGTVQLVYQNRVIGMFMPVDSWLVAWDEDDIEIMTGRTFIRRFEVTGHVPAS